MPMALKMCKFFQCVFLRKFLNVTVNEFIAVSYRQKKISRHCANYTSSLQDAEEFTGCQVI